MIATNRPRLAYAVTGALGLLGYLLTVVSGGCAKVQQNAGPMQGGSGGVAGGGGLHPPIPNLASLTVTSLTPQPVVLVPMGGKLSAMATFTAQGTFGDGTSSDVTTRVDWLLDPPTGTAPNGSVTVDSPGIYTVTAANGSIRASAPLTANFSGDNFGTGFNSSDKAKLDGSPSGSVSVAYPLDGAIFPRNFGAVTFHIPKTGAQDIARLAFTGDGLDIKHYGLCEPGPGGGCYVTFPSALTGLFLATSAQNDIKLTARLGSLSGGAVAESTPVRLAWANVALSGGLYYWTTINPGAVAGYVAPDPGDPRGTAVMRYNFDGDASKPEIVWTDRGSPVTTPPFGESPPALAGTDPESQVRWGEGRCIGCHTISPDGKLMAFSIGGSDASSMAILNIARPPTLAELDPTAAPDTATGIDRLKRFRKGSFATFTTFGPLSDLLVTMYRGKLALRQVTLVAPTLPLVRDNLFGAATAERKTDPFWSPDGTHFAFASYDFTLETQSSKFNGDTKTGGQIWMATADATGPHEDAKVIVPRQAGVTSYYPAISHDGNLVVFNKSQCSGPTTPGTYGLGACDGYDDITASLWLTDPTGRSPVALTRANGGDQNSNSWPRWSPDNGAFRGQKLYWLAFSSRRPYGLQVNSGAATAANKPQLWFSAVVVGGEFGGDPSHPPVWLPNQNLSQATPTGNHVPQWVKFAVPIE
jgi:WD40-like Beta Propeller Repeat